MYTNLIFLSLSYELFFQYQNFNKIYQNESYRFNFVSSSHRPALHVATIQSDLHLQHSF